MSAYYYLVSFMIMPVYQCHLPLKNILRPQEYKQIHSGSYCLIILAVNENLNANFDW